MIGQYVCLGDCAIRDTQRRRLHLEQRADNAARRAAGAEDENTGVFEVHAKIDVEVA